MSLHALHGLCWEHLRPGGAQHKPPIPPEGDITMNPRITTPASALLLVLLAGCGGSDGTPAVLDAKASEAACKGLIDQLSSWMK